MKEEQAIHITIRSATSSDAVAARRVQAKSWMATYPSDKDGVSYEWVKEWTDGWLTTDKLRETEEYFTKVINDPRQFYRLAENDGKIVGFVHLLTLDNRVEFEAIYTDPDTFGLGVGRRLMEEALAYIGNRDTTLTVASYNERAIRFYEKFGFQKIPDSEALYRDVIPTIRMIRKGEKQ